MIRGWETYSHTVSNLCLNCINKDSRVLEIGPGDGIYTQLILEKNPKQVTLVEPDPNYLRNLQNKYGDKNNIRIIQGDIFKLLPTMQDAYDVCVAFGVLYHWSSPFRFLEDLANIINPQYICLDNPENADVLIKREGFCESGSYWNLENDRTVNLSVHLPSHIIKTAMNNLEYKTILSRDMSWHHVNNLEKNGDSKKQTILFKFERT
jgi:SAM-dependent methyltransferase